jgi:hypothetical protein
LPSSISVPIDGSKYSISCTDGITSAVEYFSIISPQDLQVSHSSEIAYKVKSIFKDSLILPSTAENITLCISLSDGSWPVPPETPITVNISSPTTYGTSIVYLFDFSAYSQGAIYSPAGSIDTHIMTSFGTGNVVWTYLLSDGITENEEIHPFYTVSAHSMQFLTAIKKMVDKARIGDVNKYLEYTMSDLCHALTRGADYVMQSPPVTGGFPLEQIPVALKDYIVKAGAIDILRAQYQAEGMSQFDFQGLRTQLTVDRTQYLAQLISELEADLQGLPAAKNIWLGQGAPFGNQLGDNRRPIGVLMLTRGIYSTYPTIPMPIMQMGYSFNPYGGYGAWI